MPSEPAGGEASLRAFAGADQSSFVRENDRLDAVAEAELGLIVPAVMQLLGARAWWLPAPLARRLPRVALEHR